MKRAKATTFKPMSRSVECNFKAVLEGLKCGIDHTVLTKRLAGRYGQRCAEEIVDIASARLWLSEGVPITDVLTMLEARRRFDLSLSECRKYAVEVLMRLQSGIAAKKDPLIHH